MIAADIDGPRDGYTYRHAEDFDRLNRQARAVFAVMVDGRWHTLAEIERRTAEPQASISARLRDLRKERFGGHQVERRRAGFSRGLFEYRLTIGKATA